MKRRQLLRGVLLSPLAMAPFAGKSETIKKTYNLPDVEITKVKAIATAPNGIELVVVKVETSEPGLYGLGCAIPTCLAIA